MMEDVLTKPTDEGTPQGSILSPLLSNIYLHYVLDLWFEIRLPKQIIKGEMYLFRFADDFVACFQYDYLAKQYLYLLEERLKQFHLEVAEDKTKILEFGRFAEENARKHGKKPDTFDFLGFILFFKS